MLLGCEIMSNAGLTDQQAAVDEYARLLALAAHEFRTPASVVGGYLRMLQLETDTPLPDRQRKMVDEAAKACARIVALVGQLSEIGALDDGTAQVTLETFDLFADLEGLASRGLEAEDRGVRLRLGGIATGARIAGDRRRLTAAFEALFLAVLREQPTAVTILGDRRIVTKDGRASAIVVIASAPDVERAYDAVAQPFDENRGGIGLGLPIARRVIEYAGGRVWSPTPADTEDRGLRSAVVISIPLSAGQNGSDVAADLQLRQTRPT